jgi:ATP-binding cassette, subfamily B, bacterial
VNTLGFIYVYARRYTRALAFTIACMFGLVGVQLATPWVVRNLVATVQSQFSGQDSLALAGRLALLLLVLYVARAGMRYVSQYQAHVAGWGVVADMRCHAYAHLQRLSLRFYSEQQTGQLMSRVINDTSMLETLIAHAVPDTFVNVLTLIGVGILLAGMNWQLLLLTMLPFPLVALSMMSFAKYVRPAFRLRQRELAELNAAIADNLSGIREIKSFNREDMEAEHVNEHVHNHRDLSLRALRLMATFSPAVEFSSSIGTIIVIYFGGRLALQHVLPIADLVAFFLYLDLFYQPVRALAGSWESIQEAMAGTDRIADLLNEQPELLDRPDASPMPEHVVGRVTLDDVSFRYAEGDTILEHVTLDVPEHKVVALVGPTGVGKTTLVSLIPRFYDVSDGRLLLDGQDVRDLPLAKLRQQVSIVLQDVFLFHGTVRENILFGRPDATEPEMIEAAKVANAHEFIAALPHGYDTLIGERGVKLSGGQKQRLSIARAVLKDAPILVLDEATSSVDTETELLIQQALDRLIVGRTTIIIAHRLSTIRNADTIVVLAGKGIAEIGTHEQLMAKGGLYRHLCEVQRPLIEGEVAFGDVLGKTA